MAPRVASKKLKSGVDQGDIRRTHVVRILWRDACADAGWRHPSELSGQQTRDIVSVGFLIRLGKDEVITAESLSTSGNIGGTLAIPRAWIRRIDRIA